MQKNSSSKKSLGAFDTLLDIAGAAAMGAYAEHKIKKDYAEGKGEESVEAAAMLFGNQVRKGGSEKMTALGGMMGVQKAIKDIEKEEKDPDDFL